ncbi:hypothetical protein BJX96DRAFT_179791 [Aspergillus floccosus]
MSKISSEEQVSFLLSCIRFSNNGKIDFTEVAKECKIVTAAAAQKRFSRLAKANEANTGGASPSKKTGENDATAASSDKKGTGAKRKAATAKQAPSKKAKLMKNAAVAVAEDLVEKKLGPVKKDEEESELSDVAVSDEEDKDPKEEIKEDDDDLACVNGLSVTFDGRDTLGLVVFFFPHRWGDFAGTGHFQMELLAQAIGMVELRYIAAINIVFPDVQDVMNSHS